MQHPPPHCADIHCLVSINIHKCWWMSMGTLFSAWRNSFPHLCFICISKPETILSDCPSAAICHAKTECNTVPSLGSFLWSSSGHVHIFPILRTLLQLRPQQCRAEEQDHLWPHIFDAAQDTVGLLYCKGTLLSHVQLPFTSTPRSFSTQLCSIFTSHSLYR